MISVSIPQEIISLILEQYLFDDTFTLQTCALVAHSFLISSQKGLFHTIYLDFHAIYIDHDQTTGQRCQKLHQALLDNPNLSAYVRELLVLDYDKGEMLHAIMKMLPDLRLLSFSFQDRSPADWKLLSVELKMALASVFTLPSLAVCMLEGIENLPVEYFRASEHLKEMSLVDVSVARDQLDMISVYPDSKKIQTLEILKLEDVDADGLFEAMRASIDMSHLREVYVYSMWPNVIWEATKDSVHSLDTLKWDYFVDEDFKPGNMDITAFKALRVLHLTAKLMPGIEMITWLVRSLETMSREGVNNLKEIVIYLDYDPLQDEDVVFVLARSRRLWLDFDTVLTASGKFSNLDKLFICVCSVYELEIIEEFLHASLVRLSTNGILSIHATTMCSDELRTHHTG